MFIPSKADSYELLSMSDTSSDEEEQIQRLNFRSPRRKMLKKRVTTIGTTTYLNSRKNKFCNPFGKLISLSFIIVMLCCWLLLLSWIIVIFNNELYRFDKNIRELTIGNQEILKSLQTCSSQIQTLQNNRSTLLSRFSLLDSKINRLTFNVEVASKELINEQKLLKNFTVSDNNNIVDKLSNKIESFYQLIENLNINIDRLNTLESCLKEYFQVLQSNCNKLNENLSLKDFTNFSDSSFSVECPTLIGLKTSLLTLTEKLTNVNNILTNQIGLLKTGKSDNSTKYCSQNNFLCGNVTERAHKVEESDFIKVKSTINNSTKQVTASIRNPKN